MSKFIVPGFLGLQLPRPEGLLDVDTGRVRVMPARGGSRVGGHVHMRGQCDKVSDPLPQTAGVHAGRRESLR